MGVNQKRIPSPDGARLSYPVLLGTKAPTAEARWKRDGSAKMNDVCRPQLTLAESRW